MCEHDKEIRNGYDELLCASCGLVLNEGCNFAGR